MAHQIQRLRHLETYKQFLLIGFAFWLMFGIFCLVGRFIGPYSLVYVGCFCLDIGVLCAAVAAVKEETACSITDSRATEDAQRLISAWYLRNSG